VALLPAVAQVLRDIVVWHTLRTLVRAEHEGGTNRESAAIIARKRPQKSRLRLLFHVGAHRAQDYNTGFVLLVPVCHTK
jgi:hypothetical protein